MVDVDCEGIGGAVEHGELVMAPAGVYPFAVRIEALQRPALKTWVTAVVAAEVDPTFAAVAVVKDIRK